LGEKLNKRNPRTLSQRTLRGSREKGVHARQFFFASAHLRGGRWLAEAALEKSSARREITPSWDSQKAGGGCACVGHCDLICACSFCVFEILIAVSLFQLPSSIEKRGLKNTQPLNLTFVAEIT